MKKLLIVCAVFLVASGFTKEEIASKVDAGMFDEIKKAVISAKQQQDPWAIFEAVKNNDYEAVAKLATKNNINKRDFTKHQATPLMWAAARDYEDICKLLIDKGASLTLRDADGWTAIMYSVDKNYPNTTRLFIKQARAKKIDEDMLYNKSKKDETILSVAVKQNAKKAIDVIVGELGKEYRDCNRNTLLMTAVEKNNDAMVQYLAHDKKVDTNALNDFEETPLMTAVYRDRKTDEEKNKRYKIVQILLAHYAKINAKNALDKTALMCAAEKGRLAIVRYFLSDDRVQRKNGEEVEINAKDVYNKTALKYALEFKQNETAKLLEEHGAKI